MGKTTISIIVLALFVFYEVGAQDKIREEKALAYFCKNINQINKEIVYSGIKFSGNTKGISSDAYDIAHCIGEINLLKDSIPIRDFLDSLNYTNYKQTSIPTSVNCDCGLFKKHSLKRKIYALNIFEAIEYNDVYYVELYLVNKQRSSWIICVKFNQDNTEPSGYCIKYIAF